MILQHEFRGFRHHLRRKLIHAVHGCVIQNVFRRVALLFRVSLAPDHPIADVIVDQDRSAGQSAVRTVRMRVFPDELAVFIHAHAVGIGNDPDFSGNACRTLSDVHLGSHLEHGRSRIGLSGLCILPYRALSGVDRRRGFGISEHVADAVVADPVAAAEIAVRIIVGETPAECSRDIPLGADGFKHVRVTDRLFLHGAFAEERRSRIHVTVILADQVRLRDVGRDILFLFTAGVRTAVKEVIIGIDVLEQTALFQVTDAAGSAGRIELVSSRVRSGIERVVVLRFIDPDAP